MSGKKVEYQCEVCGLVLPITETEDVDKFNPEHCTKLMVKKG